MKIEWAEVTVDGIHSTALTPVADAVAGASSGFVSGGILGGNLQSAWRGAATGGLFGGVSAYAQDWSAPARIGARAFTGGVSSELRGGDFGKGFIYEGVSATASWRYQQIVGFGAHPEPGQEIPGGQYLPSTPFGQPPEGYNVIALNRLLTDHFWSDFFTQGGALSKVLNLVPGINATADLHDTWWNVPGSTANRSNFLLTNVGSMLPAAAISYGALLDGPLSVDLAASHGR